MKATKILLAAVAAGILTSTATVMASPRSDSFLAELKASGSAGGDKIDRSVKAVSPRAAALAASYEKSGTAGGDKIDRMVKSVPPRMLGTDGTSFSIAPVK
ncbi:MAG: hypothetical protein AB1705_05360 [Verrucomicrobiota bacterium]